MLLWKFYGKTYVMLTSNIHSSFSQLRYAELPSLVHREASARKTIPTAIQITSTVVGRLVCPLAKKSW